MNDGCQGPKSKLDSAFDLVVIGHLLKEKIIFPDRRETGPVLGSPCAYISAASARLGIKTGIVTKIGEDMPEGLLKVFTEAGVDTKGVRTGKDTTTNLLIYESEYKKRLEFLKKAPDILFEDIPSGYLNAKFFILSPIDYEIDLSLIKSLHRQGKRLSMELSGFGGASSGKDGRIPKEKRLDFLKEIIPYFEIIKGGREDCQCLFGTDALNEKEIAGKFIDWGAKVSVITIGEEGALVVSGDKSYQFPIFPAKVVDCTGAGDVFHAGFLTEYLNSGDLQKSARFALATASLIIERTGGVVLSRMPVREEVLERMRKK